VKWRAAGTFVPYRRRHVAGFSALRNGHHDVVAGESRSEPEEVVDEAARGRSSRTPALLIGGVATTIGVVCAIVVAVALALYLFL
jgi:hypothetical protein